jgi:hypothetical protein
MHTAQAEQSNKIVQAGQTLRKPFVFFSTSFPFPSFCEEKKRKTSSFRARRIEYVECGRCYVE